MRREVEKGEKNKRKNEKERIKNERKERVRKG